jgi:hypothetical protein
MDDIIALNNFLNSAKRISGAMPHVDERVRCIENLSEPFRGMTADTSRLIFPSYEDVWDTWTLAHMVRALSRKLVNGREFFNASRCFAVNYLFAVQGTRRALRMIWPAWKYAMIYPVQGKCRIAYQNHDMAMVVIGTSYYRLERFRNIPKLVSVHPSEVMDTDDETVANMLL